MKGLLERLKTSWPGRLGTAYGQSKAGSYAAGLAFNGFMTMFPLILGLLSIVGLVVQDQSTQERLQNVITGIFPSEAHKELTQALHGVKDHAGLLGVVSIAGLVWGGTGFFGAMEFALTQIFGTRQRDLLRQKVMGVLMMLLFLAALLLTAGANSLAGLPFALGKLVGFVVGATVLVALLIAVYRFVPNRSFALRDIWPGAVFAGVLIEILSLVFPIYANIAHGFNTYGQQFALFFLLATWLYLLSQLLLLGAVFNRMRLGPPEEEGVIAQPGDRGEIPPAPAEAIDEQRGEGEAEPAASGRAQRATPAGGGDGGRGGQKAPGGKGGPTRRAGGAPSARPVRGRLKGLVFGLLGAVIGLFALSRAPKAPSRDTR